MTVRGALTVLFFAIVAAVAAKSAAALFGIAGATQMGRIRAARCGGALSLLFATFESIRRTHLKGRYALLWVIPSFLVLALAFFPGVLDAVRRYFGMEYGSTMAGIAFFSLLAAVFAISRTISRDENNIAAVSQAVARLEARVRDLEKAAESGKGDVSP